MRSGRTIGMALFLSVVSACATRAPVVTSPAYPSYVFPAIPSQFDRTEAAEAHDLAWRFLQTGDVAAAEARFTEALAAAPAFYPAHVGLGWVRMARADAAGAVEEFEQAIASAPAYVPALVGRGDAMFALDRPEDALGSYEAALEADPRLSRVESRIEELRFTVAANRLERARDAAVAGRFEEAVSAYEEILAGSPESGFLHLELARVERERGNLTAALDHARHASELDPEDVDALLIQGELYEARGELSEALRAYKAAEALDPSDETARRVDRVHDLVTAADLPEEVLAIATRAEVTRGELAALIGVRLPDLLAARSGRPVIMTDNRDYWGGAWIQAVVDAGLMTVDAGYRFSPTRTVPRSELADVVAATLDLLEEETGSGPLGRSGVPSFSDMRPSHLSYEAAMRSVAAGVLDPLESNSFQPSRVVTGSEAVDAVDRLAELARRFF